MDADSPRWELVLVEALLIAGGVAVQGLPSGRANAAGVLAIGVGCGVLAILARRAWRGWS